MPKRPLSITVIAWIFIAAGLVGLTYHASEFDLERPFNPDFLLICFIRLMAIVCGAFLLRGSNWARWGLVLWLGYHILLSLWHTLFELAVHGVLFSAVIYFLFRPKASAFLQGALPSQHSRPDDVKGA